MKKGSASLSGAPRRAKLWLAFWGGGLAWFVHLLVAYGLGEFGCVSTLATHHFLAVSSVAWLLLLASAACLAAAGCSTRLAWRARAQLRSGFLNESRPQSTEAALAETALIANLVFLFIIAVQTIPVFFFLRNC